MARTTLEQEMFEQFMDQGLHEDDASEFARDWAIESGEYLEPGADD